MKLLETSTRRNANGEDFSIEEIFTLTKSIFNFKDIINIYPLKKGYGHKSWKLIVEDKPYILKINVRHSSLEEFENEVFSQNLAAKVGIITAAIVAKGTIGNEKKYNYYVQEWIEGEDAIGAVPKMSTIEYENFFYTVGCNLAKLHKKHGEYFSDDIIGYKKVVSWKAQCKKRLRGALDSLKNSTLIDLKLLNSLEEKIIIRIEDLSNKILPSFVHGDLHLGNIIVNNGEYKALIDFESSRFADSVHDFVKLDNWVFSKYKNSYENFILGYRSISHFEVDFEERLLLYKAIEILYSINYFGILYPNKEMMISFIDLLNKINCKI